MNSTTGAAGVFDRGLFAAAVLAAFFDGFDSVATRFVAGFFTVIFYPSLFTPCRLFVGRKSKEFA
jgi:hypothetical protein